MLAVGLVARDAVALVKPAGALGPLACDEFDIVIAPLAVFIANLPPPTPGWRPNTEIAVLVPSC